MPFPLAHPAAVLPLRRFCPQRLDFSALVIGSVLPDMAYTIDDLNKFSRTLVYIFGPAAEDLPWVKQAWDWDDFSHTFLGSIGFCLPLGFILLMASYSLRLALVRTLPNPHRDALLPLGGGRTCSLWTCVISLLIGIWTHIAWDSLTNSDRWLGQHWAFLRSRIELGSMEFEVCRLLWLLSSVGGMLVLFVAYLKFLKHGRSIGWLYQPGELAYYLLWLSMFVVSALVAFPLALQFASFLGSVDERLAFLHRFAGYFIATASFGVFAITLGSMLQRYRVSAGRTQSRS